MAETKIIIIRHGETEWNLEGRCQGHLDSPLTKKGLEQAKALANSFIDHEISRIYSSDLGRALQTAEQISRTTNIPVKTDVRLRERHCGIFQGLIEVEMKERMPAEYGSAVYMDPDYIIPEGESANQLFERSISCINEIAQDHSGETLAIVTHGGVLENMFKHVMGLPLDAPRVFKIWNTGKNTFSYKNGKWEMLTFGDIKHLQEENVL